MTNDNKQFILHTIDAVITLEKTFQLLEVADALDYPSEEYRIVDNQIDNLYEIRDKLIQAICDYTGVDEDDFIGDGFMVLCDKAFSGSYYPEEVLQLFENIDSVEQREWLILHNLDLLSEFNEKVQQGIDVEESRRIFNIRFKWLLEHTDVPDELKMIYANVLLDYVSGRVDKECVLDMFSFYIYK